ncbi:hypothetical protein AWW67_13440 [Roseivirga seohaensis]|uniref:Uncharacterized protein n=1 Tax=Roseivirga seohaensis TaxID=1914963 RepID=A0A150XKY1_9BACT|nr:hypothetical protein [Roseivirga seohaensis]KYG79373.1 hypothetical protein AWW67_13440 [Roseivirga seohaensis]
MEDEKDNYDEIMKIMQVATNAFWGANIPKHEIPHVLADYIVISIIGMCEEEGEELTEKAVMSVIERMKNTLNDWKLGKGGFDYRNWKMN